MISVLVRFFGSIAKSNQNARPIVKALQNAARAAGYKTEYNVPGAAAFNVTWTNRRPERVGNNAPTLILESGYTCVPQGDYISRRLQNIGLSWNKLNEEATWIPDYCPSDRWDKLGIELKPWKQDGEYSLVLGQVAGDATVCHNYRDFLGTMESLIEANHPYPVKVREHPQVRESTSSLAKDLKGAALCITYSSNSAVEAVIAGVPTVVIAKNCVAWPVTSHIVRRALYRGPREQWAYDLAYRQYTVDELRDGTAWEQIEKGYERVER